MSVQEKYTFFPLLAEDLEERLQKIPALLERHAIRLAYLFGSCARAPKEAVDVDLAIFPDTSFDFQMFYADLSELFGTDRVDLTELPRASLWLRQQLLGSRTCIYKKTLGERLRGESASCTLLCEVLWGKTFRSKKASKSINPPFLQEAFDELSRVAVELRKYGPLSELETWTIERELFAGLTLVFQIADHLLPRYFERRSDRYEGLLRKRRSCGVISKSLYSKLRSSGGICNILVHEEYVQIDLQRVREILSLAPGCSMRSFRGFRLS